MKAKHDPSTEPYYRCLSCIHFRKECGGIPTRGMDLKTWCEYMRDVRDLAHLHNTDIAREADVSIKTLERIMAINIEQDIMRATARRIELAIIGPVGNHACYLDYGDSTATGMINRILAENDRLLKANDRYAKIIDEYLERKEQNNGTT